MTTKAEQLELLGREGRRMTDPDVIRRFVLAGDARFEIERADRVTLHYRISPPETRTSARRVDVGLGEGFPKTEWGHMGWLSYGPRGWTYRHADYGTHHPVSIAASIFRWFTDQIIRERNSISLDAVKVYHDGYCPVCRRPFRRPNPTGIGPKCAQKLRPLRGD